MLVLAVLGFCLDIDVDELAEFTATVELKIAVDREFEVDILLPSIRGLPRGGPVLNMGLLMRRGEGGGRLSLFPSDSDWDSDYNRWNEMVVGKLT